MNASTPTSAPASRSVPARLAKVLAIVLLAYLVGLAIYSAAAYGSTKARLLTYGLSEATANFLGIVVMLVALGLPAMAIVRIAFWRPRPLDYGAALILPGLSWAIAQLPAKFDSVTGEALQYCALRPDGSKFCLDRPGVDPLTQQPLVKVTRQSAEEDYRRDKNLLPQRLTAPIGEIVFFDPITGHAKVWVSKNDVGCYDMFNNPGVNPYTGDRLEAVTKPIVQAIRKCTLQLRVDAASKAPSIPVSAPEKAIIWKGSFAPGKESLSFGTFPKSGSYRVRGSGEYTLRIIYAQGTYTDARLDKDGNFVASGGGTQLPYWVPGIHPAPLPSKAVGAVYVIVNGKKSEESLNSGCFLAGAGEEGRLDINAPAHPNNRIASGALQLWIAEC